MSSAAGPSVVTSGLVLDIDMSNTQKSWKGKPTTNLLTYSNDFTNGLWSFFNVARTLVSSTAPDGSTSTIITNIGSSTMYVYRPGDTAYTNPSGTVYALSCNIKNQPTSGVFGNAGISSGTLSNMTVVSLGNSWYRHSFLFTTNVVNGTISPQLTIAVGQSFEVQNMQTEVSSFATPYIPTTSAAASRSNTQAIVDLTNNNTLTATSLTYASDNTFSFNGSSDYIDVTGGGFVSGMSAYSITHWSRRDIESRMPIAGRTSTAFYQYGDNSWKYLHGGVSAEYYYPRAVSIPLGTYGFYCIVYNGANVSIYRNGVFEGSQATTGTADWSQGLKIGNWSSGSAYSYSGAISSVSFYNRALSATEVQQNFNAARARYGL